MNDIILSKSELIELYILWNSDENLISDEEAELLSKEDLSERQAECFLDYLEQIKRN